MIQRNCHIYFKDDLCLKSRLHVVSMVLTPKCLFSPRQVISTTEFSNHLVGGFNRNISQSGWFPQFGGKNAKCLSCHHLATYTQLKPSSECFPPNPLGSQKYATSGDQLPRCPSSLGTMGSQVSSVTSFLPIYKPTLKGCLEGVTNIAPVTGQKRSSWLRKTTWSKSWDDPPNKN